MAASELPTAAGSRAATPEAPTRVPGEEPRDASDDAVPQGVLIDGLYRLVRPLGRGGMGLVMLARDQALDRDVAIKLIRPLALGAGHGDRFLAEARAMARVSHPNVLQIFGLGNHDGAPYLVMEFVPGQTVAAWLRASKEAGVPPDIEAALKILDATCLGAQAIHDAETVHFDLKPSNLLLDDDMRVRVADLGLADLVRDLLRAGKRELAGTWSYMAPEIQQQLDVAPDHVARADVYSLGCIAYELLTGYAAFDGPPHLAPQLERATELLPPSTVRPDLDPRFDDVVLRALASDPAARTPTPEAFRRELAAVREGTSEPTRILLAEDDPDSREVMTNLLEFEFPGAEIEAVEDGAQALAAFDAQPHSVAIIDLNMPEMDGITLTGHLRSRESASKVPIIVLTASGGPAEWKRLSGMGADGFLVKPVDIADVVMLVRRTLGQRMRRSRPPAPA